MTIIIGSAFFVYARAQTGTSAPITENESAALKELSQVTGETITTRAEAQAVCNEERYLNTCVEIGKKHSLYAPKELEEVDELLAETKGAIMSDLEQCKDETCLLEAARRLTEKITKTKPELAKQFDLTKEKVAEKKKIAEAAKEIGVSIAECKNMDPDTASVELLRSCARLAKDKRVNEGLSESSKQKVEKIDKSIDIAEALKTKKIECGDGTVEGCGNFCLNPGPEARAKGVEGIPAVCRQIAEKFYGAEGIRELEAAYQRVGQVETYVKKQTENLVFKTLDGKKLYSPAEIGKYLETEGKKGNVEAVTKGMDFLLSYGFIKEEDKNFALKMVGQIRTRGVEVDFDSCKANPQACQDAIPDEYKAEFTVMDKIESIIKTAMQAEGVPDPSFCDDPRYGEACIRAAERVLPQIEGLGSNVPQAQSIIAEIKAHITEGKQVSDTRNAAKRRFEGGQMTELTVGGKTFTDFNSLEAFCKTNGALCLAEVAKQGIISQDVAAQKFTKSYEKQYKPQYTGQDFFGPEGFAVQPYPSVRPDGTVGTDGGVYGYNPPYNIYGTAPYGPTYIQGSYAPGYEPNYGQPATIFDKEEALRQFKKWLENPQGPAPIPIRPPSIQCAAGENLCPDGRCVKGSCATTVDPYPRPAVCPAETSFYQPCPEGQSRETKTDQNGCVIYGQCQTGGVKPYPEPPYQTITFPYTFSSDAFVAKTYEEARRHCYEAGSGTSIAKECGERIGYTGQVVKPVEYPTWISHEWKFSDGSIQTSYIFVRTDREYTDYIQKTESQCRAIPQYKFKWRGNAQDANPTNWQNFGIPDCSGTAISGDTCIGKYGPGWVTRERTTGNCYDSYTPAFRTSQGTLYSCSTKPATISAPGCTTTTTTPTPSTSSIATSPNVYPGDENSCPGFAYSVWDTTGKRYCRLNAMQSCQYNYPSYLTESNYKPENCPSSVSTGTGGSGNWVNHLWTFSNGTQPSYILNRTDQEYQDYIKGIETQCKAVRRENFCWKSGAGNDSDWRNFGIPDCSGTCSSGGTLSGTSGVCEANTSSASCYTRSGCAWYGTYCGVSSYSSSTWGGGGSTSCGAYATQSSCTGVSGCSWAGTYCYSSGSGGGGYSSCSASLTTLLGTGCHYMYNDTSGKQTYCDGPMTKSAKEGDTATTSGCSSSTTTGSSCNYDGVCNGSETSATCASDCRTTTGGGACGTSTCAPGDYCANSTNGWCCPSGMSICSDGRCVWGTSACGGSITSTSTGTTGSTCSPNLFNGNSSTQNACSYSYCPNGCTLNSSGCATGCNTVSGTGGTSGGTCTYGDRSTCEANSTCWWRYPSGSTTGGWCEPNSTTGGTYSGSGCGSYATQSSCTGVSGCSWAGTYCYNSGTSGGGGTTSGSCIPNEFNNQTTNPACSYTKCPSGCTFDTQGCPSGCLSSGTTSGTYPTSGSTTCSPNEFNSYISVPGSCNSAVRCPTGCVYDSNNCATGCSSTGTGGTYTPPSGGSMTCTNFASAGQGCNPSTGTCCSSGVCSNTSGPGTCQVSGAYIPMTEQQLAWACDKGGGDWDGQGGTCERSSFLGSIRNAVKKMFSTFFGRKK
ncbi:MAG: hypothetical protein Q8P01_02250 [bacterium]|nr:hypothetical protein [bacterium]